MLIIIITPHRTYTFSPLLWIWSVGEHHATTSTHNIYIICCWCLFMTDFSYTYLLPFKWINYRAVPSRLLTQAPSFHFPFAIYLRINTSYNKFFICFLSQPVECFEQQAGPPPSKLNGICYWLWLLFTQAGKTATTILSTKLSFESTRGFNVKLEFSDFLLARFIQYVSFKLRNT